MVPRRLIAAGSLLAALVLGASAHAQCREWFGFDDWEGHHASQRWVKSLLAFDDGTGPALYVAGRFVSVDGVEAFSIARWDGAAWSPVGAGFGSATVLGDVGALVVFDDGSGGGPALYAAASVISVTSDLYRWDGSTWTDTNVGHAGALTVWDDGGGPTLYGSRSGLVKWAGSAWTTLVTVQGVDVITVHADGTGSKLYFAGEFWNAEPGLDGNVAVWNGSTWARLGLGLNGRVNALATFDDGAGGGPALFAAGEFTTADGAPAPYLAKWDGTNWYAVPDGPDTPIESLFVYDDGTGNGPELYAGGQFTTVGGAPIEHIARWDGSTWSGVGVSVAVSFRVEVMATFDAGPGGPDLYAGGSKIGGVFPGQERLARWGECYDTFCNGWDGALASCPCGNAGDFGSGCDLAQGTGGVALSVLAQATVPTNRATLAGSGFPAMGTPAAVVIRGPGVEPSPVVFGDGLRCVGMPIVRLGKSVAVNGSLTHTLGHGAAAGAGTFYYQLWFRNQPIGFCDPGAAFNLSNGVAIPWP